ncbi:MAG TPA: hypothetical protein VGV61_17230 [Thermoanaerobaculia bacterium]|jgi:hypothetical protein|nr:hypothetical protein [Thermoanaerobaculia bacterium]
MTGKITGLLVAAACLFLARPALAIEWRETADRAISLLDSSDDADARIICMLNKVKDDATDDRYISDYYNVQQTAGGLPENVTFERFVEMASTHTRDWLSKDGLWKDMTDDEIRSGIRSMDAVILKIFGFLNANVHQAGAGNLHVALWNYILDNGKNASSLYSCYSGTFIDER